jgi:hypothetical protein
MAQAFDISRMDKDQKDALYKEMMGYASGAGFGY